VARNLLVADRQYLLLKLREVTFGDRVQATIFCPWPDCGKKVDIDFSVKDIPITESEHKGPVYTMELSPEAAFIDDQGEKYRQVIFRLPNGGDQETIFEKQMEAVAPKVESTMGALCPECGREFVLPFDLQEFFFDELKISRDLLYREVHYLAYHYHWSEGEIMEMSREKRRRYIEVLADEIERLNSAV
jgi:hypothetical protein